MIGYYKNIIMENSQSSPLQDHDIQQQADTIGEFDESKKYF